MEDLHNESLLVQALQSGSEEAFTALYRYYSPRLYVNILAILRDPQLTEEIIQELFTRLWQKRESKGISENFKGYLYRIGQNLVHDFFRNLHRNKRQLERFRHLATEHYVNMEEALHYQESNTILQKAIELLPPQQKKVYQLVKIEGCSYKQAATLMGISPFTVKEYLVSANKSIRHFVIQHIGSALLLYCFFRVY